MRLFWGSENIFFHRSPNTLSAALVFMSLILFFEGTGKLCENSVSRSGVADDLSLLGCFAKSTGKYLPTFRKVVVTSVLFKVAGWLIDTV
jgi:hypothetical protein